MAFQQPNHRKPPVVSDKVGDVQAHIQGLFSHPIVLGGPTDTLLPATAIVTSVQSLSSELTELCRAVGSETHRTYAPSATPGVFLRGLSRDIAESQYNLAQAASVVHNQLATQIASEATHSLLADSGSLLFREHKAIFGCPSRKEYEALHREVLALRASAQPPRPSSPGTASNYIEKFLKSSRRKLDLNDFE